PTHLDSHQHVHRSEPTASAARALAAELNVPLRQNSAGVTYCGRYYGQSDKGMLFPAALKVESLIRLLSALKTGTTELGCHPGFDVELDTMYRLERRLEVETLCDTR